MPTRLVDLPLFSLYVSPPTLIIPDTGTNTDPQILGAFGAVGVFGYFLSISRIERPVAQRSYPYGGLEKELGGRNAARIEEEAMDE
jgi:hypothetical protein